VSVQFNDSALPPPFWEIPATPADQLRMLSKFQPSRDEHMVPLVRIRPLGPLSDYVCSMMPVHYDAVLAGAMRPQQILDEVERVFAAVDIDVVEMLVAAPHTTAARVARLDIAFLERLLCVAHGGPSQEYRARRAHCEFFKVGVRLAKSQQQSVFLGWPDIAGQHPAWDPRTFLSPGRGRDQEVLLYRVQHGIDRVFQRIVVEWPQHYISPKFGEQIADDLDAVVEAMIHLSRVRDVGEFDKLNHFLTPNGEAHGHATGSFSVWTMLAGYLLTGKLLDRLVDVENRWAFDADARGWIDAVVAGEVTPLPGLRGGETDGADVRRLTQYAMRQFGRFHEVHRGAVRRHAAGALDEQAPSNRLVTNRESFDEFIAATKRGRGGAPDTDGPESIA